jgi:hypothetical protein
MKKIIRKTLFNDIALVPTADYEIVQSVSRKKLHDVPEDRLPTDLGHRLWSARFFLYQ